MGYHLDFTDKAKSDIAAHKKAGNKAFIGKLYKLLDERTDDPFKGTGKPEPLKHEFTGCWSRRINKEHRQVYEVSDDIVNILSAKGHY